MVESLLASPRAQVQHTVPKRREEQIKRRERREIKMQASPYQEGSHSFLAQCGEISHAFSYPFSR